MLSISRIIMKTIVKFKTLEQYLSHCSHEKLVITM